MVETIRADLLKQTSWRDANYDVTLEELRSLDSHLERMDARTGRRDPSARRKR